MQSSQYLNAREDWRQLSVENGEMFTEADIQTSAKVCVIGKTIQDNLFPGGEDPVGRIIRFNQVPFRVVGVLKAKGYNSMGMDQDDVVLAPYTTVMKRLPCPNLPTRHLCLRTHRGHDGQCHRRNHRNPATEPQTEKQR